MKNKPQKTESDTKLVIVESPTKIKTLQKYFDKNYSIMASLGHVIDLPKSRLAVDIENNFLPDYITVRGRAKVLKSLKKAASKVNAVYLASDPDREGEAISYHLKRVLEKHNQNIKRIVFNEITKEAVLDSLNRPRDIDMNLFYAQQARRILDRLVGYQISPVLWKKLKKGLSAGRVQSPALRLICEREKEIDDFIPQEFWTIDALFKNRSGSFTASLFGQEKKTDHADRSKDTPNDKNEKFEIHSKEEADRILQYAENFPFIVSEIKESQKKRNPLPPFNTSKMQQDAANRLGFPASKTMMIAQQLYEGVALQTEGQTGLITYMRTDSVRIADQALARVRDFISQNYSADYLPAKANFYALKKGAQNAHEAIRPTDPFRTPESIRDSLTPDQFKLYSLIWSKFVSSQMTPEIADHKTIIIRNGEYLYKATGKKVVFPGFTKVQADFSAKGEDKQKKEKELPQVTQGEELTLKKLTPEQHFTTPPSRYNDATLVKILEESGVGRPSTYAPIISTLLKRYYIQREKRQLKPTLLGKMVNDMLVTHFPELLRLDFTAGMEKQLDQIEEGERVWSEMLKSFYGPFKVDVDRAMETIAEMKSSLDEPTDYICEKCGSPMVKKLGKYGFFLACSAFPKCHNAQSIPLGPCPLPGCQGSVVKRATKRGRDFFGCSKYPDCEFTSWEAPLVENCPLCNKPLFPVKKGKGDNLAIKEERKICLNPDCNYSNHTHDNSTDNSIAAK